MIDLSFIGNAGLVIDYEDLIAMIGINVVNYFKANDKNFKTVGMSSQEDIFNSYINRSENDISIWLKENFDITDFDLKKFCNSSAVMKPNIYYCYRIIPTAFLNGIKSLYIYSQYESKAIRQNIKTTFDVPISYVYGDIREILSDKLNYTYITANPDNVRRCQDIDTPLAVVICDDYMSMLPVVQDHVDEALRKQGKFVSYTSVLNAGVKLT